MEAEPRVCPFCGEPPGPGMFCAACGRNLGGVDRLPTRSEWESDHSAGAEPPLPVEQRCAAATAAFLASMHAAGDPGLESIRTARRSSFGRTKKLEGWVVRPVDRDDDVEPRRYEAGLVLTVDGRFHRLDNEVRGWGQRNFPYYESSVDADPVEMPIEERLVGELGEVLRANGLTATFSN